ncbi:MAG: hypothetical protein HYZ28_03065 [Myxococcales bacterium]|nr:hypothetical protein [Myxococcales bacterium]
MIRTQISFDPPLYRAAQAEASRRGISLAELCRRALARELGKQGGLPSKKPWMRFAGVLAGGGSRASENEGIDRDLYGQAR